MSERTRITLRDLLANPYTRLGIELAGVVLGFWLVAELSGVLTPVLVGLLLAYMVDPLVSWMQRRGFSRVFSVTVVFGGTALLLLLTLLLGLPKAWHEGRVFYQAAVRGDIYRDSDGDGRWKPSEVLLRDVNGNGRFDPSYVSRAYDTMRQQGLLEGPVSPATAASVASGPSVEADDPFDLELWAKTRLQILVGTVQDGDRTVVNRTLAVLASVGWWTIAILLIPVYGYFFSLNLPAVSRVIVDHIPPPHRDRTLRILSEINLVVGAFFRGRVAICAICAVISMIGFGVSGVPSWAVLGVIMGFGTAIPLASGLTLVPAAMLLFLDGAAPWQYVAAVVTWLVVQVIEPVLIAVIMGKGVEMHPVIIVVAILAFGTLLGPAGFLLAVPLAATARILWREFVYPHVRRLAGLEESAA